MAQDKMGQDNTLLIFFIVLAVLAVVIAFCFKMYKRSLFNNLYNIKTGDSIKKLDKFNEYLKPLTMPIDDKKRLVIYQYNYWIGFILGGTKTKTVVFIVSEDTIICKSEEYKVSEPQQPQNIEK